MFKIQYPISEVSKAQVSSISARAQKSENSDQNLNLMLQFCYPGLKNSKVYKLGESKVALCILEHPL